MHTLILRLLAMVLLASLIALPARAQNDTYSQDELVDIASDFFGESTALLARTLERIFKDQGQPNGYITGEEISGAALTLLF